MSDELSGHEGLVAELRAVELDAPARLRARVLAQEARRRPAWRLAAAAAVATVAACAAIGGGVASATRTASPASPGDAAAPQSKAAAPAAASKATRAHPEALPAVRRTSGWSTTEGALAGAGGGLVLTGAGIAFVRLRRRAI